MSVSWQVASVVELVVHVAREGCTTSPPSIGYNDKMRVWQMYGVLPKTPDIQQNPTCAFVVVLLGLSHHDASYNLFNLLSSSMLSSQRYAFTPNPPFLTAQRNFTEYHEDIVGHRSYVHSTWQNTRVPVLFYVAIAIQLTFAPFGVRLLLHRDRSSGRPGPARYRYHTVDGRRNLLHRHPTIGGSRTRWSM